MLIEPSKIMPLRLMIHHLLISPLGFIFPNIGFILGTVYIGQELESNAVLWVSAVAVIVVVAFWLLDLFLMFKAVFKSLFLDPAIKLL